MTSKAKATFCLVFLVANFTLAQKSSIKNIDIKVDSLMNLMTLEEKIGQLNQMAIQFWLPPSEVEKDKSQFKEYIREGKIGSILGVSEFEEIQSYQKLALTESRLKIPLLFGFDIIHGAKTIFPIPLATSCSWDLDIIEQTTRAAAKEASAMGLHWTFAPMVDVGRDPRWGRVMEGAGEDPFLGAAIAKAQVRGFQGNDLAQRNTILACAKHFAGYGFVEGGRDYNSTNISLRTMRETILPPFKAATEAGVATFMNAFNDYDGVPASQNSFLIKEVLKKEWNFKGFVVSDWGSINQMINWGVVKNNYEAAEKAIKAGTDMDMMGMAYVQELQKLVADNKVKESRIDDACRRILTLKFQLGLFSNPNQYLDPKYRKQTLLSKESKNTALLSAQKSIVLLKNKKDILPLKKLLPNILVVGAMANSRQNMNGAWSQIGDTISNITILEGIKSKVVQSTKVEYVMGACPKNKDILQIDQALAKAGNADVIVMTMGEYAGESGEAQSYSDINIKSNELKLFNALVQTGKPIVVLLINGRPLVLGEVAQKATAIVETWFLGNQAGNAIADVLFGDCNPSGKLTMSFPVSVGQIPVHYDYKLTGRTSKEVEKIDAKALEKGETSFSINGDNSCFRDISNFPLYPFGFGLSYTTFQYSNLTISKNNINEDDTLIVSVSVKNTGKVKGEEISQLYIKDIVASTTPPVKQLKGFIKTVLNPGESKELKFVITKEDLSIWDVNMNFVAEPGDFKVLVGGNSVELLEASFNLK